MRRERLLHRLAAAIFSCTNTVARTIVFANFIACGAAANEAASKIHGVLKINGQRTWSRGTFKLQFHTCAFLLAEALFLVFVDERKETYTRKRASASREYVCSRDKLFSAASFSFFFQCFFILRYCLRINCNYVTVFFVGEKNGKIKIVCSFSAIKLCFVINVLNNKTIILFSLAEYPLILAKRGRRGIILACFSQLSLRSRRLSFRRYSTRFRRIIVKYPMAAKPMKTLELHYPMTPFFSK